jgi:hypothetical protein
MVANHMVANHTLEVEIERYPLEVEAKTTRSTYPPEPFSSEIPIPLYPFQLRHTARQHPEIVRREIDEDPSLQLGREREQIRRE